METTPKLCKCWITDKRIETDVKVAHPFNKPLNQNTMKNYLICAEPESFEERFETLKQAEKKYPSTLIFEIEPNKMLQEVFNRFSKIF